MWAKTCRGRTIFRNKLELDWQETGSLGTRGHQLYHAGYEIHPQIRVGYLDFLLKNVFGAKKL